MNILIKINIYSFFQLFKLRSSSVYWDLQNQHVPDGEIPFFTEKLKQFANKMGYKGKIVLFVGVGKNIPKDFTDKEREVRRQHIAKTVCLARRQKWKVILAKTGNLILINSKF